MKIRTLSFLLIILVPVLLSACATQENYALMLDEWKGKSEESLLTTWGIPDKVYDLTASKKMVAYNRSRVVSNTTPVNCAPTPGGMDCTGGSTNIYQQSCETTFTLEKGIVKSWQAQGNDCRL